MSFYLSSLIGFAVVLLSCDEKLVAVKLETKKMLSSAEFVLFQNT